MAVNEDYIDTILGMRHTTHGDYDTTAEVSQRLKRVLTAYASWNKLSDTQRESLDMVCTKMGRIMSGNPNLVEHWLDAAGYMQLIANELTQKGNGK